MDQGPLYPDPVLSVFGQTVRAYRIQRGLKQRELAKLADIDHTYISGIERGRRNVSLHILLRLSAALEVPLSCLLQPLEAFPILSISQNG